MANAGDNRLFIVEKDGTIAILDAGAVLPTRFSTSMHVLAHPAVNKGCLDSHSTRLRVQRLLFRQLY